jgi:hypothetical protein
MSGAEISSRFIVEVEKQLHRRRHVLLYGNIHDQFLWRGAYVTVDEFLNRYFLQLGFELITQYDPVDGFRFGDFEVVPNVPSDKDQMPARMEERFHVLVRRSVVERYPQVSGQTAALGAPAQPTPAQSAPANPLQPPPRSIPGGALMTAPQPNAANGDNQAANRPSIQQHMPRRVPLEEAFAALRTVLGQPYYPSAAIVSMADMLTGDAEHYQPADRPIVAMLLKCMLEAAVVESGPLRGYRNTLVIKAADLTRVPDWIYRGNPFISLVQAGKPDRDERKQYALNFICPSDTSIGFYGGDKLAAPTIANPESNDGIAGKLVEAAEEFADLTDGMQAMDLEALRVTSWKEQIAVRPRELWRLIDFFKFGLHDDPWEKLSPERVRGATQSLSRRVIGQPAAIDAVTNMLTTARVGLSMSGSGYRSAKPRGIFFFVGPTGVGKTELAKAVTELVFGDERAFCRFDMSEYTEEHAAEKLAGAPPGYEGYEAGGQLTNWVLEHPHSILLFDEIEKAHPRVLDKFLQILEDGRLTDGKGQTAYFNQSAIIFTSNIGASDLTDPQLGVLLRSGIMNQVRREGFDKFSFKDVENHFRTEVEWFFTSRIGRAELLNRLGDNIVVFDLLRPDYVEKIAAKFLKMLAVTASDKYRLTVEADETVITTIRARMSEGNNMLFGGRRIKSLLETLVERPLNRWLFENHPDMADLHGSTLHVSLDPETGALRVIASKAD